MSKKTYIDSTCRPATIADAAAISKIWKTVCAERIYTAIHKPFSPEQEKEYITSLSDREGIFVAETDCGIIAFQSLDLWATYTDSFNHAGVIGTIILPEWRRKGIGRKLSNYTFQFARAHGYEKIIIYVRGSNKPAQAFYKRLGFIPKGVLKNQVKIDGQYDDEIFMELFL